MEEGALVGMFDLYRPAGPLRCPFDDHPLERWQGKDGPRLLLVWQEGMKHPVDDWVDEEVRFSPADLDAFTLPPTFTIYSLDCPAHRPIIAACTTADGIWRSTEVSERDQDPRFGKPYLLSGRTGGGETTKVREFILVDLATQMPYLPNIARAWPRERLLAWLRVWGEVHKIEQARGNGDDDSYTFQSWVGRWTPFVLTPDGRRFIPGTSIRAWPEHTP